uniref:NADH dehydrogenase subunit 6 n=1 Tax=Penthetria simplicipes TaxID=3097416 RepID=UPI002E76FA78|nr:NADH dehydrogenase subunit 6 [Penthetria simplicipes]WPM86385.1 NADH dehydrogenase subunit 6 [Penthetria simplicipes]
MLNFIMINFLLSMIFLLMKHPLMMGMMLLIQTMLTCLIMGIYSHSFWYSYIIFIVFLGGMLVLFMYMTSIASNEKIFMNSKVFIYFIFIFILLMLLCLLIDKNLLYPIFYNMEMMNISMKISYFKENSLNLMKLYNFPNNILLIMLINYLLLTLIIIVKITNIFKGPLRSNI